MAPKSSSKKASNKVKHSSYAIALAAKRSQKPMPSINNKLKRGEVYAKVRGSLMFGMGCINGQC